MSVYDHQRRNTQRKELTRETIVKKLLLEAVLTANEGSNERVDAKRRLRMGAEEQRERDMLMAMESKRYAEETRRIQEEQEMLLAQELERQKNEQLSTDKRRQQLRENASELRELEAKLKAAYLSKELYAQRAEKDATQRTDRQQDLYID